MDHHAIDKKNAFLVSLCLANRSRLQQLCVTWPQFRYLFHTSTMKLNPNANLCGLLLIRCSHIGVYGLLCTSNGRVSKVPITGFVCDWKIQGEIFLYRIQPRYTHERQSCSFSKNMFSYFFPYDITFLMPFQVEISPLLNAVETVESKNKELDRIIANLSSDRNQSINPLSMILNGIIDAAVMGGIAKYEEVR